MRTASLDIKTTIRDSVPRIPFEELVASVLGSSYQLSLVLCGDSLARRINRETRKKQYAPNVLSFPIDRAEGEIFLNVRKAQREARVYGTTLRARVAHLFVHGLYHLKGHDHESDAEARRMEAQEAKTLRAFALDR